MIHPVYMYIYIYKINVFIYDAGSYLPENHVSEIVNSFNPLED